MCVCLCLPKSCIDILGPESKMQFAIEFRYGSVSIKIKSPKVCDGVCVRRIECQIICLSVCVELCVRVCVKLSIYK